MTFQTEQEIWELVTKFERCELPLAAFDHALHLAVGMAYLSVAPFDGALARMRASLERFSAHHGKMGYHETITRFWLMKLAEVPGATLPERATAATTALANKDLIFAHYGREVLMGEKARREWVAPDRGTTDSCSLAGAGR